MINIKIRITKWSQILEIIISQNILNHFNLINIGHLKAKRQGFRYWIKQGEIDRLLEQLPRSPLLAPTQPSNAINLLESNGQSKDASIPDLLREQREALLDYAREPLRTKKDRPTKKPTPGQP